MTTMDRRTWLARAGSTLLLPIAPSLFCTSAFARSGGATQVAALLLPLSGERAGLGNSMARAAALAQPPLGGKTVNALASFDTLGTPAGAAVATQAAVRKGAPLLLGPLLSGEVRPALAAAARIPMLVFSNDESLRDSGAFLLGVTASQLVGAILQYARRRGVRRVTVLASGDPWSLQATAAARRTAALELREVTHVPGRAASETLAALRGGGELPDAVLVSDVDQLTPELAAALRQAGVQILGGLQAIDDAPAIRAALTDAWLAAPDPTAFGDFAGRYEAVHGSAPGAIAALAYDAVKIALAIAASGQPVRDALLSANGFAAVTGAVRFRTDGSASRTLSILTVGAAGYRTIDSSVGA